MYQNYKKEIKIIIKGNIKLCMICLKANIFIQTRMIKYFE